MSFNHLYHYGNLPAYYTHSVTAHHIKLLWPGSLFPAANNNTGVVNGEKNSNESIDELPEENREGSFEEGPSYSSSLMMKSEDSNQRLSNGYVNGGSHYSPISNRTGPNGHRRTGSDPFAFKQPLYHNRLSHPRFTVGSGANGSAPNVPVDLANVDFRGEAITFKATTAGIISTLGHCIDVMNEREKYWQKKFELVSWSHYFIHQWTSGQQ